MPRAFSKNPPTDVPHDPVGLPRTFKPDHGTYIYRLVKGFDGLDIRHKRCLSTKKVIRSSDPPACLPVAVNEWKAARSQLEQAHGQVLYSAVQAAGIFQNCRLDLKLLSLAVGFGWARPWGSSWPGESSTSDVRLVRGDELDLGTLKGAVACFLMIFDAVQSHILSAYDITRERLNSTFLFDGLERRVIVPGPLVNWRLRTLPPALMSQRGSKRKAKSSAKSAEKKTKLETTGGELEVDVDAEMDIDGEGEEGPASDSEEEGYDDESKAKLRK